MKSFLRALVEWLGAPALIPELRSRIAYLEAKVQELERERGKLQDSVLLKHGVTPLDPPELPPPTQQVVPFDDWLKKDIEAELRELEILAQEDPDTYRPLLEEAILRYRDQIK